MYKVTLTKKSCLAPLCSKSQEKHLKVKVKISAQNVKNNFEMEKLLGRARQAAPPLHAPSSAL